MADNYDDYSREELIRELRLRDRRPRFGLVWERKEIEHEKAINDDFVTLTFDPKLSCGDAPYPNLIVEGDNFDALRYLRMTHAGKVKCIYIDPPYNTGNRDFIYNDRFVDKEDGYRHSKWLEFMYRRLLLAEDGVIFVSIDDNEVFNLGLLMNQVFGESNFVAANIWQKRYAASNDHKSIAPMHEYIFVYQASDAWNRNLLPRGEEKDKQYRNEDEQGVYRISDYTCNKNADERPNLYYPILQPNTGEVIWPKTTRVWAYSKGEHERHVREGLIYWGKDGLGKTPSFKRYKHLLKNADGIIPNTWWTFDEVGHTDTAKKELLDILAEHATAFSTPKPTQLIERILRIATKPGDLVLDFFAGSGTTAHAVLKLNAEDGGNRRFILVSSTEATAGEPDKNLCRDVCAERVRRVVQGYVNKKGEPVAGLGGDPSTPLSTGFAYLRTARLPGETLFTRIQHADIWIALQLIHAECFSPFDADAAVQILQLDGATVVYLPRNTPEALAALQALLDEGSTVVAYSWQPGQLRQHVQDDRLGVLPIPQFLVDRFGCGR